MEAISHAGTVVGVLAKDGVVLAAEKKVTGKLLDLSIAKEGGYGGSGEKIYLLNKLRRSYSFNANSRLTLLPVSQQCYCGCRRHHSRCKFTSKLRQTSSTGPSILV